MRRAWPPVYRPTPQHKVVPAAAVPPTTRYRRDTVAASGTCFVIAAPCSCGSQTSSAPAAGPLTVHNHQVVHRSMAAAAATATVTPQHHRGPPPPLPARNGGGCPYRCCSSGRSQKPSFQAPRPPVLQHQQRQHPTHHAQQQRPCAYVRPRPSRSLENLLRVVELDDTVVLTAGHRGVYEKSCHYGNARRKMKVPGKENRHAWKRRSMESLLSARDNETATKTFEFFHHVRATA